MRCLQIPSQSPCETVASEHVGADVDTLAAEAVPSEAGD